MENFLIFSVELFLPLLSVLGEEFEDDENEGEKILSEEEFKNLAIKKIEMRL